MHVIRLRGNWSLKPLSLFHCSPEGIWSASAAACEPTFISEPAHWLSRLGPDFRGRVRLARRFHSPTGITPKDVVAVTFEHSGIAGCVVLDGTVLADFDSTGADRPILFWHDIRAQLQRSHELAIEIEWPKLTGAASVDDVSSEKVGAPLLGTVRLEIGPA